MKGSTDLAKDLSNFLGHHLPHERGLSPNTIKSYSFTFILLINYLHDLKKVPIHRLSFEHLTMQVVVGFLDWLQAQRHCTNATRNQRLAAITSFVKFVGRQNPGCLHEVQQILSVRQKRSGKPVISHLTVDGITLLMKQPDTSRDKGLRDLALMSLMYESAARVQEIIDLTPSSLSTAGKPYRIELLGKGNKHRIVPLPEKTVEILLAYLSKYQMTGRENAQKPLFQNAWGKKMTRNAINNILKKHLSTARQQREAIIPSGISCHSIRHSKAMALLDAKVQLIHIRDFLGHKSVLTTEIYARINAKYTFEAIKDAYKNVAADELPIWHGNEQILKVLKEFSK